jgi:hypothetical protein
MPASPPLASIHRVTGRPGHGDRPPLPAGHPLSWGLLTDRSPLRGAPYPFPVFLDQDFGPLARPARRTGSVAR